VLLAVKLSDESSRCCQSELTAPSPEIRDATALSFGKTAGPTSPGVGEEQQPLVLMLLLLLHAVSGGRVYE
jgi:hypothetical protein